MGRMMEHYGKAERVPATMRRGSAEVRVGCALAEAEPPQAQLVPPGAHGNATGEWILPAFM
jgi:hypothetical protein